MNCHLFALIPALLAISLSFITKRILLSLSVAVVVAYGMVHICPTVHENMTYEFFALFYQAWVWYTLGFALLVGAIIRLLQASGAVDALVQTLSNSHALVTSKRRTLLLGFFTGVVVFIESSITTLLVALITKPFAKIYGISKEKIAYLCDTTSAPICTIIPINGWGALLLALIAAGLQNYPHTTEALDVLLLAVLFNAYAWISILVLLFVIFTDFEPPIMKQLATPYETTPPPKEHTNKAHILDFFVPLIFMVGLLLLLLYTTKEGSFSIFVAVTSTVVLMYMLYVPKKLLSHTLYTHNFLQGIDDMKNIVAVLAVALLLSHALELLGMPSLVAHNITTNIPPSFIPALLFSVAALIAFSTGSSWATFAMVIPIAFASVDTSYTLAIGLAIGAVVSGGIFGDHSSPLSDTTIISSLASECDIMRHVQTQLPFALFSGVLSLGIFTLLGVYFL